MATTPDLPPAVPPAEPSDAPFADAVAANRGPFGWVLLALGVACLAGCVYLFAKPHVGAWRQDGDATAEKVSHPHLVDYSLGGVVALFGGLSLAGVGVSLLAALPRPTLAGRRAQARTAVLAAGGLFGAVVLLGGFAFFGLWFTSVSKWLVDGKASEARYVLAPLLAVLVGGGVVFAAAQPARAEERNNPTLRRLVYGANLGLTALLLLVLLVVGNVVAATRLTEKIDTTEGGFYTFEISPQTREFLRDKLTDPVMVYSTIRERDLEGEGQLYARDTHRLLEQFRDANPGKFRFQELNRASNTEKIRELRTKYGMPPEAGLLVVVGADEKRHGFIRFAEMVTAEDRATVFRGESRLVQEILVLGEGGGKPVVYFSQGSGELSLAGGDPGRAARDLKAALEQNNVEVKAWNPADAPPGTPPAVPADATVLIVADPTTPLNPDAAAAVGKFVSEAKPNGGKKGKLIVASGARPGPTGEVNPTGLEGVLAGLGVRLGDKFLYGRPVSLDGRTEVIAPLVLPSPGAEDARNPIALAWDRPAFITGARTAEPAPGPDLQVEKLLETSPELPTWQELTRPADPMEEFRNLMQPLPGESIDQARERIVQLRARKQFGLGRGVAVTVREGEANRAVVFGYGEGFAPGGARTVLGGPRPAQVIASAVDWLRDRPPAATIPPKRYGVYVPNPKPDGGKLLLVPGVVAAVSILAAGVGVWALRRG